MTTPLTSITVTAPGSLGLNKQNEGSILPPQWATEATNCVIDDANRLTSRKGFLVTDTLFGDSPVQSIFEYIDGNNNKYIIVGGDNSIYYNLDGTNNLTSIWVLTATQGNHWKFQNFNGKVVGWQRNQDPIVWSSSSANFSLITAATGGTIPKGNEVLAAYGRLWAFDATHTELHYSDLLLETTWEDATSPGSSGVIDLKSVWVYGRDEGVAISSFNGYLIVFGKNSILVYQEPTDPDNMVLVEHIKGIGCIARDSVQIVGDDIIFLSNSGVRSLSRVVQEKSMPFGDESKNVRDYLMSLVRNENSDDIKSTYSQLEGFYLLSLPTSGKILCFDMRTKLEDGSRRVTEWDGFVATSLLTSQNQTLYIGTEDSVGIYYGYQDAGTSYDMTWYTGWVQLTEENRDIILKNLTGYITSEYNISYTFKWAFDFSTIFYSATKTFTASDISGYNEAEYNVGEYSGGEYQLSTKIPGLGVGQFIKFGGTTTIDEIPVTVQQIRLQAKIGRMT